MKQAVIRGFKAGLTAGLTGRTRKSEAPKIMTSLELQTKAWNMTGDSIRKAMDRR
jgi:hypothetical protein